MTDKFHYEKDENKNIMLITYKEIKFHQKRDKTINKMLDYPDSILKIKNFLGGGYNHKLIIKFSQ